MMENKNFCQSQEKLSEDAWKILAARTKKKEIKNHSSEHLVGRTGGGDSARINQAGSSNLLFKLKRLIRRIRWLI